MGAIASVLQWHCEKCSLINPTEHSKCLRCGALRRSNNCEGEGNGYVDGEGGDCGHVDAEADGDKHISRASRGFCAVSGTGDQHHSSGTIFGSNANCTVIRRPRRIPQNNQSIVVDNENNRLIHII